MIYIDSSVFLAQLLAKDRVPPTALWAERLVASRLLAYEAWTRLNRSGLGDTHGELARDLLARITLVEMAPLVLERALARFPAPIRTLDALHLATIAFVQNQRIEVALATYDQRLAAAARALEIPLLPLV